MAKATEKEIEYWISEHHHSWCNCEDYETNSCLMMDNLNELRKLFKQLHSENSALKSENQQIKDFHQKIKDKYESILDKKNDLINDLSKENKHLKEAINKIFSDEFLEVLAELEHKQWQHWRANLPINKPLQPSIWINHKYKDLPEATKDEDRVFAKIIIDEIRGRKMKIHKAIYHKNRLITTKYSNVLKKDVIYLCNQAVKANRNKCRFNWKYVTCKNCLKQQSGGLGK